MDCIIYSYFVSIEYGYDCMPCSMLSMMLVPVLMRRMNDQLVVPALHAAVNLIGPLRR